MRAAIIETNLEKPFGYVFDELKKCIMANGFLLIHEINTQEILAGSGIEILPLRQLLFFHPMYMKQILDHDTLAVNEAPLKIVVREISNRQTNISFPDPRINFGDYKLPARFAEELFFKLYKIISKL
jgi:uncharacterized protein (DUF302 family)